MSTYVYLAGVISCYEDLKKPVGWRKSIDAGLKQANELYGTSFKTFNPTVISDNSHNIVSNNLHYLKKSDIMVLNLEDLDKSLGSIVEMAYFAIHNKPIITINYHEWLDHPYLEHFNSMELIDEHCVVDFLVDVYGQ